MILLHIYIYIHQLEACSNAKVLVNEKERDRERERKREKFMRTLDLPYRDLIQTRFLFLYAFLTTSQTLSNKFSSSLLHLLTYFHQIFYAFNKIFKKGLVCPSSKCNVLFTWQRILLV